MRDEQLTRWLTELHNSDAAIRNAAWVAIRQAGKSVLPKIVSLFESSDNLQTRADAGMALNALADPSTILILRKALHDEVWEIRRVAVWALGAIGKPAIPALIEGLGSPANNIGDVRGALAMLGDEAISAVLEVLPRSSSAMQLEIVMVITRYAMLYTNPRPALLAESAKALLELLKGPSEHLRLYIAQVLGYLRQTEAIPTLLDMLLHDSSGVDTMAMMSLGMMGEAAIPGLMAAYKDQNEHVRANVVTALGRIGGEEVWQFLRGALFDSDVFVRKSACEGLASSGDPRFIADFMAMLRHATTYTDCQAAAEALAHYGDPQAEPLLSERLLALDERWLMMVSPSATAKALVKALQAIGTPETLRSLEEWERRCALFRSQPFSNFGGIDVLRDSLTMDQVFVRQNSLRQLIDANNAEYIADILGMVSDPDWGICIMAIQALSKWNDPRIVAKLAERLFEIVDIPTAQATIAAILTTLQAIGGPEALQTLQKWRQTHSTPWN